MPHWEDDTPDFNIETELQNTFKKAVMQHEAQDLKRPVDWQHVQSIQSIGKSNRGALNRDYQSERDQRVDAERQRLMAKAGELNLDHPRPFGAEKVGSESINHQAELNVEHSHENDLLRSRDAEKGAIEILQQSARERGSLHGKLRENFNQSSNRRIGPDRRGPNRTR